MAACNAQAEQWLIGSGLAMIKDQQLTVVDSDFNQMLQRTLSHLLTPNMQAEDKVIHHWKTEDTCCTLLFQPLNSTYNSKTIICLIYQLHQPTTLSRPALQKFFDLSSREMDVCNFLVQGYNCQKMGEVLNLSVHTIRDVIKKRLFKKCRCHSQAQLIALLLGSPALMQMD